MDTDATQPRTRRPRPRERWSIGLFALAVVLTACSPAAVTDPDDAAGAATGTPAAPRATAPPPTDSATTAPPGELMTYEATTPVPLTDVETYEAHGIEVRDVTYPSSEDGDVLAYLAEPVEDPAAVGILMTHDIIGLTNHEESRERYLDAVARFACAGATAIVVDAPWARGRERSHDTAFTFTDAEQDVAEQIQMIADLRRAVDVLEQLGAEQIGFTATGSGATYGAMLAGVEPRIDAFSLLGGGAGPVNRFISETGNGIGPAARKTDAELQAWADEMQPLAPIHLISEATSPILFVVGRDDQVFSVDEMKAVSEAAGDVSELRVYDAGRDLNTQAFQEQLDWLADQLGLDQDRVDICFDDTDAYVAGS